MIVNNNNAGFNKFLALYLINKVRNSLESLGKYYES